MNVECKTENKKNGIIFGGEPLFKEKQQKLRKMKTKKKGIKDSKLFTQFVKN